MSSTDSKTASLHLLRSPVELERFLPARELASALQRWLQPWHDPLPDVERGLRDALQPDQPLQGFVLLATRDDGRTCGALVMLSTGMDGYIPGHLLLYIAVDPATRGQGLGGRLIEEARRHCPQGIKLHVELENPAGRLYERLGFTQKYREMRWLPAPEGTA